jgi:hypothetical protein
MSSLSYIEEDIILFRILSCFWMTFVPIIWGIVTEKLPVQFTTVIGLSISAITFPGALFVSKFGYLHLYSILTAISCGILYSIFFSYIGLILSEKELFSITNKISCFVFCTFTAFSTLGAQFLLEYTGSIYPLLAIINILICISIITVTRIK